MDLLHVCPANIATGGTENIHQLVSEINAQGYEAAILYTGGDLTNPQPAEYQDYNCPYVTEMLTNFDGVIVFPEIWADKVTLPKYSHLKKAVNWQGVDVYYWHNHIKPEPFLQVKDVIHFTTLDYGMDHLQQKLGLDSIKVNDCLNEDFLNLVDNNTPREDRILYNPTPAKLTQFQQIVMQKCLTERGIKFTPIQGYSRKALIELFQHSKLYVDFGVFSGRERLPREAVMCGCCILTSKLGAAHYYGDMPIPEQYKLDDIDEAVTKIKYLLEHYDEAKPDFNIFRTALKADKAVYSQQVKELCNAFFCNNTSI